jgi:large repetitive protein
MRRAVILFSMMSASLAAQPASVEGTVVDQTTGKPVARVHVRLNPYSQDQSEAYGAMSDSSGHFSIAPLSPGRYDIRADRTGYVQMPDSTFITLKPGRDVADLKVKMALASMLSGRVVDQYGDAVAGEYVRKVPALPVKSSPGIVLAQDAQTDDRGEFHFLTGPVCG